MKNIVYVIVAETRLSGNFNVYPEVRTDLQEAFDYAETYCSVLIDKLVSEKGYSPDSCRYTDQGTIKWVSIGDGDEYARLEIFRKEIDLPGEQADSCTGGISPTRVQDPCLRTKNIQ